MRFTEGPVVVTGGASGLGQASAQALVSAGAPVAIWDRDGGRVREVATALGCLAVEVDVSNEHAVAKAYAETKSALGVPRGLVHCAGVAVAEKLIGRSGIHALESFERVVRVNLFGSFYCCRAIAGALAEVTPNEDGERGVLILTASIAAFEGQVGQLAYSAAKAGVVGMTLPLARDLASLGIRVMTIAPGVFMTPILKTQTERVQKALVDAALFPKRCGEPEEFASLVLEIFRNRMLNGGVIRLDGGMRLAPR